MENNELEQKNKIDTKEISVLVQGPINMEITPQSIESVRKYLPEAEIILSTWVGSNTTSLDYDILVLSEDPGGTIVNWPHIITNNCNRQLVGIQNGLKKVKRKYCLKLRTDFILLNDNILKYWDRFPFMGNTFKIFKHRILTCSVFSQIHAGPKKMPLPFDPSDFYLFALTKDLKDYFLDTVLMREDELTGYEPKFLYPDKLPFEGRGSKFSPEQHYCLSWVKRHIDGVKYADYTDWNDENFQLSNNILFSNFAFLSPAQSGITGEKYDRIMKMEDKFDDGMISYKKFQEIYKTYFDSNYEIEQYEYREIVLMEKIEKINELMNTINQQRQTFLSK